MPHTLRAVDRNAEVFSALKMLSGLDDDIARDATRTINRLRSILVQIYPSLERVFAGEIIQRAFVLDLLIRYGGPRKQVLAWSRNHSTKDPEALADSIFQALAAQSVTVPGTAAAEVAIEDVGDQHQSAESPARFDRRAG